MASDSLSPLLGTNMALGVGVTIRRPHLSLRTQRGLRCLLLRDPKWCSYPSCEYPKTSGSPCAPGESRVKLSSSSKVAPSLSGTNVLETNPA